ALDPLELIEEYGADSVRFTLMSQFMPGKDMKFSVPRLEGYRNFMNKIWNAARFSLSVLNDFTPPPEGDRAVPSTKFLSDADVWITYKLEVCETKMDEHLKNLRLADAAATLYDFVWHQFCDWYLELIKPVVYGTEENNLEFKKATQLVLAQTLNRIVRLLHPFVPFISEEIYQKLPIKNAACILESYPNIRTDKEWLKMGDRKRAEELDLVLEVISAIRNIRGENRIKPGEEVRVRISPNDTNSKNILLTNKSYISKLSKLSACDISSEGSTNKCALTPIHIYDFNVDVIVYLEGVVDLSEECKRISKAIEKFQKEMSGLSARLKNDNFTKNAPVEVVEQGRAQLIEIGSKIKALQENLERLS
ncbi:MAG: class I tRNA ligase family protein, partial [Bdellovibrionales bacterium]